MKADVAQETLYFFIQSWVVDGFLTTFSKNIRKLPDHRKTGKGKKL